MRKATVTLTIITASPTYVYREWKMHDVQYVCLCSRTGMVWPHMCSVPIKVTLGRWGIVQICTNVYKSFVICQGNISVAHSDRVTLYAHAPFLIFDKGSRHLQLPWCEWLVCRLITAPLSSLPPLWFSLLIHASLKLAILLQLLYTVCVQTVSTHSHLPGLSYHLYLLCWLWVC